MKNCLQNLKSNLGRYSIMPEIKNYSFAPILIEIIEKVIDETNELREIKEENENNLTQRKNINHQLRYAICNLLRILMMEYSIKNLNQKNKIISYVDWCVTPTANLGSLPKNNCLYGANVYTGLYRNGGNYVENTAIFYRNIDSEENIFYGSDIKLFYFAAVRIIQYLGSNEIKLSYANERSIDFTREIMFNDLKDGHSNELKCEWVYHEPTLNKLFIGTSIGETPYMLQKRKSPIYNLFLNFIKIIHNGCKSKEKSIKVSITRRSGHA